MEQETLYNATVAMHQLSLFIDALPEEDTTEDLNELIQKWDRIDINTILKVKVKATGKVIDGFYDGRGHFDHFIDHDVFDRYSIDEVELMSDEEPCKNLEEAIDAEIVKDIHNLLHVKSDVLPMPSEFKFGDKVKIIILKDDEN